jgi:D-lactate dehydrogenase
MHVAVFDTHAYDRRSLLEVNRQFGHDLVFFEPRLTGETVTLARGFPAVCVFVNDRLDRPVLQTLREGGTQVVALRCAGFNNVELPAAEELGVAVARVPAYSPHAVAQHTVALLLCLNRKIHRAFVRVREGNFSLNGLVGYDLNERTVGVLGTGQIGRVVTRIMRGFGCRVLACDPFPDDELAQEVGCRYVTRDELFRASDILSLHVPLGPETTHLVDARAIATMKPGVIILNTSRGGIIDTTALIAGLKSGQVGGAALDVYEREAGLFFEDCSDRIIEDDDLARLLMFPNVLITGHQAFLTETALRHIAETTLDNIARHERGEPCANVVTIAQPHPPRV